MIALAPASSPSSASPNSVSPCNFIVFATRSFVAVVMRSISAIAAFWSLYWTSAVASSFIISMASAASSALNDIFFPQEKQTVRSLHLWNLLCLSLERSAAHLSDQRSEEHTSELQSLMRISYAVFCLKKKKKYQQPN